MSTPSGKPFDQFDHSPYAPKRAREHSDRPPVEIGGNHESEDAAAIALAYVPRAAMRPAAADEHPADLDAGEPDAARAGAGYPRRRGPRRKDRREAPATMPHGGADLARLESSLQWLQRESSVSRLPRAVPLPPVSGLRPVAPESARAASSSSTGFGCRPRSRPSVAGCRRRCGSAATICAGRCACCWRA